MAVTKLAGRAQPGGPPRQGKDPNKKPGAVNRPQRTNDIAQPAPEDQTAMGVITKRFATQYMADARIKQLEHRMGRGVAAAIIPAIGKLILRIEDLEALAGVHVSMITKLSEEVARKSPEKKGSEKGK